MYVYSTDLVVVSLTVFSWSLVAWLACLFLLFQRVCYLLQIYRGEALWMDTLVSGQLFLRPPWQNPVWTLAKRPGGCPLTGASTVIHFAVVCSGANSTFAVYRYRFFVKESSFQRLLTYLQLKLISLLYFAPRHANTAAKNSFAKLKQALGLWTACMRSDVICTVTSSVRLSSDKARNQSERM